MKPVSVPTLAEVVAQPDCASKLPPSALSVLIAQTVSVEARLALALAVQLHQQNETTATPEPTKLITVAEAAAIANVTPRFFYSHKLRFVKRLSRKKIRIDETGLRAWLASR